MADKRRVSNRLRGPPAKTRKVSTSPITSKSQTPVATPVPASAELDGLPTRYHDGKPLPTCKEPQDVTNGNYQNIAER